MSESQVFVLRDYQRKAVDDALKFINSTSKKKKKPIIVAPTGAGKSLYIANIIKESNKKTIIIQPNVELLKQNLAKYLSYGNEASVFSASVGKKDLSDVTFATIGSIKAATDRVKELGYDLLLVDEAHYMTKKGSQIDTFLNKTGIKNVIGFTATPLEARKNWEGPDLQIITRSRSNFFNKILNVTQIKELVDQGFWADIKYKIEDVDTSELEFNTSGTEYTSESQIRHYDHNDLANRIYQCIRKEGRKHNIVFVPDIESCKNLAKFIPNSACVYSGMKADGLDREQIVKDFKSGVIETMINCNILSIGFDFPELNHIILARPTSSFNIYYQQLGRGVRIHPDKKDVLITDFSGNVEEFGTVESIRFDLNEKGLWEMYSDSKRLTNRYMNSFNVKKPSKKAVKTPTKFTSAWNGKFLFGEHKGKRINDPDIELRLLRWVRDVFKANDSVGEEFKSACIKEVDKRSKKKIIVS